MSNALLSVTPTDNGLHFLFQSPVGTTSSPAVVVGHLVAPIEVDDPATGRRRERCTSGDPTARDATFEPDPMMVDKVSTTCPGSREFELTGDLATVTVDGVAVWSKPTA